MQPPKLKMVASPEVTIDSANQTKHSQDNAQPMSHDDSTVEENKPRCPSCSDDGFKFVPVSHTLAIKMIQNLMEVHSCFSIMR